MITCYRLRKLANSEDYKKDAISIPVGIASGIGLGALASTNSKYKSLINQHTASKVLARATGKKLKALKHAAISGALATAPASIGAALGVGISRKLGEN